MNRDNIDKKYFVITIDSEADNAWSYPEKIEMRNFKEIPRFQKLCERYNIIPTYLLTYEYATYQPVIDYLKPKAHQGKCEIGYHLHVWSTPPFQKEKNGVDMDWLHAYQFELPDDLFEAKANTLLEAIYDSFDIFPKSHRAGRWGIDERTIDWLVKNNFTVDSSIVPQIDYSQAKGRFRGGPTFLNEKEQPYVWITKNGNSILESPVSVNYPSKLLVKLRNQSRGKLRKKILNKICPITIFRPNPSNSVDILNDIMNKDDKVLHFMLHSSELAINCSPFTDTEDKFRKVWKQIEDVLKTISAKGYQSIQLSDLQGVVKT